MKLMYMDDLAKSVKYSGMLKPSSAEDIALVEQKINARLPRALYEFFLIAGKDYDEILRGGGGAAQSLSNYDYIHKVAMDLLKSCDLNLEAHFPFVEYGDLFLFVYLNEGEDPPVYRFETELFHCGEDYMPGSSSWGYPRGVCKVSESFSGMVKSIL